MSNEERSRLEGTTHCRCGAKWGEHCLPIIYDIKYNCVVCGKEIGVWRDSGKDKIFVPNQFKERYEEKGNYCDRCNNVGNKKYISSNKNIKICI